MTATRHYDALDGLRGVAALAVVSLHVAEYFRLPVHPGHAYLAVDFFFMLSGFVIAHAYDRKLQQGMALRSFMSVRLIRLLPLVVLGVILGAAAYLAKGRGGGIDVMSVLQAACLNMMLLPSPSLLAVRPWAFPLDTPLWSLTFEIWVNFFYAVFFKVLTRRVLEMALVVGAVLIAAASLANAGLNIGFTWTGFYLGGARVLFPFVIGVVMNRYLVGTTRTRWGHAMFLPLMVVLCGPTFGTGWFDLVAVLVVFPIVLLIGSRATISPKLDPLWRRLGWLSYPIYVLHYPFVVVFSNLAKSHNASPLVCWIAAIFTIGFILVFADLGGRLYDAPLRAWISRFLASRRGQRSRVDGAPEVRRVRDTPV